jgi:signal transduction histidine kinase/HAMP domain-containing protein
VEFVNLLNQLIGDLVQPISNVANVIAAVAEGNLSETVDLKLEGRALKGQFRRMAETINTMVSQLSTFAAEVTRVAREVGYEGKLGGRAVVPGVAGSWKDLTDNVNQMASNLTQQVRNIADVTTAVAKGDLSRKITVEAAGEIQTLKDTVNVMVDQLSTFAAEVTRVAREVGTEGQLGGQATVAGVSGTWKDLTDNVNQMASNLTDQVRGIIAVVAAVASGNLRKKLTVAARGEIAGLSETMNDMIDTLAVFADQVSNVAREVGVEGRLGGQARVPGALGVWADLTDNVNELANNLTTQVRSIAEVSTAVTEGDLSRRISVEARGEVATLKDNINEMILSLALTTQVNTEQDWLKTNLTNFTRMLQGEKDLRTVSQNVLRELASVVNMQHGVLYLVDRESADEPLLFLFSSFGYRERKNLSSQFRFREGLVGQAAYERERIVINELPDDYIRISSGLGDSKPRSIVVLPISYEDEVLAVLELASFESFTENQLSFLDQLSESVAININNIQSAQRTEDLLRQSQGQTEQLQRAQEELRHTNDDLEDKARLLVEQKREVEEKNSEVEKARLELMEQAEKLALSSRYKSEFLANMSHELRTPLNSLLILSQMLADNKEHNLTDKQVEFASTIYSAGWDLLGLINEILDLAKIESGTMTMDFGVVRIADTVESMREVFQPLADEQGLGCRFVIDPSAPDTFLSERKRLEQVLKNLLSNAIKFTAEGAVELRVSVVDSGWSKNNPLLDGQSQMLAFSVVDTGIGIPRDKQAIIFEVSSRQTALRPANSVGRGSVCPSVERLRGC